MSLFPFFINIEGKAGVITGGGKHALEKIERILPYEPQLTVFETEFREEIKNNPKITLVNRKLEEKDLDSLPAFVIVAGEDAEENHQIAKWCNERRILVNVVDDQPYCEFIFPSLIAHGNLSVGICTNGASPAPGVLLKGKTPGDQPGVCKQKTKICFLLLHIRALHVLKPSVNGRGICKAFEKRKRTIGISI